MEWWHILLISGSIALIFYFIAVIIFFIQIKSISAVIEKRKKAIDVLIVQKYDILLALSNLYKQKEIVVPSDFILDIRPEFAETLTTISSQNWTAIQAFFEQTAQTLFFYGETCQKLQDDEQYATFKQSYHEIDHLYRRETNMYNATVLSFNYWVKLFGFRWVCRAAKIALKELFT